MKRDRIALAAALALAAGACSGESPPGGNPDGRNPDGSDPPGDGNPGDPPIDAPAAPSGGCGKALVPGDKTHTITVNGASRTYLVQVVASLDADTPAPVLLGFHGGSGTSQQAAQQYGLTGTEPMLYVYPQAPFWPEAGGVAWNVDPNGVDFPYFDAMLADIGENYCIDKNRVFATGQSNGAFFVHALGCYRPGSLRGIGAHGGGGPPGQCNVSPMAAMIAHGRQDGPPNGPVAFSQGENSRDYWLASNGCSGAASTPTTPSPCVTYTGCARPVTWCAHPAGHPWPAFLGAAMRNFFLSL